MNPSFALSDSRRRDLLSALAGACVLAMPASVSFAQTPWPSRSLRLILGFAPGGAGDIVARFMAQKYSEALGQPVVVENRPGANSTIAATAAAKAAPDGYTLYMGTSTDMTVAPTLLAGQIQYSVEKDFTPLGLLVVAPNVLVVPASSAFKTVDELVRYAKANPDKLTFASFGSVSTSYLAPITLNTQAGLEMTHVPFKGSAPAIIDLIAGRVDLFFDTVASATPHVKSGKLRALAVTSSVRSPLLPDVPTMIELGHAGFIFGSTVGMLVPSGTPAPIAERLQAETAKIIANAEVRQFFNDRGMIPVGLGPKEYGDQIRAETARSAKLIRERNLKFD